MSPSKLLVVDSRRDSLYYRRQFLLFEKGFIKGDNFFKVDSRREDTLTRRERLSPLKETVSPSVNEIDVYDICISK